eukprot:12256-Hanusia_phi.AAC.1
MVRWPGRAASLAGVGRRAVTPVTVGTYPTAPRYTHCFQPLNTGKFDTFTLTMKPIPDLFPRYGTQPRLSITVTHLHSDQSRLPGVTVSRAVCPDSQPGL